MCFPEKQSVLTEVKILASTFELEIITPDKVFYKGPVEMAVVRTVSGDVGIEKEHMSMVSPLAVGIVKIIEKKGQMKEAACAKGFVQVKQDKTTILTDAAEFADEIDVDRAQKAADRAEERLNKKNPDVDIIRAQIALDKALNRLRISKED